MHKPWRSYSEVVLQWQHGDHCLWRDWHVLKKTGTSNPNKTLTRWCYTRDSSEPHLEPGWPVHQAQSVLCEGATSNETPRHSLADCPRPAVWRGPRSGAVTHTHLQISWQLQNISISTHNFTKETSQPSSLLKPVLDAKSSAHSLDHFQG